MSLRDEDPPPLTLEVGPGYTWFAVGGVRMDLRRRDALRRLLATLVEARVHQRGPVSAADLVAATWPRQEMTRWIASNRLRQSLHTLRKLGLRPLLLASAGGYQLDPRLNVKFGAEAVAAELCC